MAEENFGADSGLKAISDVHLALALHARGEVAATAERLLPALPQLESSDGWLDIYAEGYEVAIANALARGDKAAALELCERMSSPPAGVDWRGSGGWASRFAPGSRMRIRLARLAGGHVAHDTLGVARAWRVWASRSFSMRLQTGQVERGARGAGRSRRGGREAVIGVANCAACGAANRRRSMRLEDSARAMHAFHDQCRCRRCGRRNAISGRWRLRAVAACCSGHGPGAASNWSSARSRHVLACAATMLARASAQGDAPSVLSARELEVLVELARGAPNKDIARMLHMTENTVKYPPEEHLPQAAGAASRRGPAGRARPRSVALTHRFPPTRSG